MSDTPRTDEAVRMLVDKGCGTCVPGDFARQLERELAEAQREINGLHDELDRLCRAPEKDHTVAAPEAKCHACGLRPRYEFCRDPKCPALNEQQYAVNNFTNFIAGLG